MTQLETNSIQRLLKLAHIAQEFEFIQDLKLPDHFNKLREEHGLSKLLLLIQEYITNATENKLRIEPPKIENPNQNPTLVQ